MLLLRICEDSWDVGCEKRLRSTPPGVYCLFTNLSMSEKNQTDMIIDYIDYCISFIISVLFIDYRLSNQF